MRIRVRFRKAGKVRFLGHRDVARVFERALRRADLPLAYTEGFSPRPKVHFGLALGTGYESLGEYLDIDLVPAAGQDLDLPTLPARMSDVLPIGIDIDAAAVVDTVGAVSLQQAVTCCTWRITVAETSLDLVSAAIDGALSASSIEVTRQRKGKDVTDDLRPYLHRLEIEGPSDRGTDLIAELGTQPRTLRPSELLAALDPALTERFVCRLHQWIETDDGRIEPLALSESSAALEVTGAS